MSIKFRRDGAVFPTEVKDGTLLVHVGNYCVTYDFPFIKGDYPYNNIYFPISNIMAYLENSEYIIVMRFDGTVTKYLKDGTVIGFTKFNKDDIYEKTVYFPFGIVSRVKNGRIDKNYYTSYYMVPGGDEIIFEETGQREAIILKAKDNPKLIEELQEGYRLKPRLFFEGPYSYRDDNSQYRLIGQPINTTGNLNL